MRFILYINKPTPTLRVGWLPIGDGDSGGGGRQNPPNLKRTRAYKRVARRNNTGTTIITVNIPTREVVISRADTCISGERKREKRKGGGSGRRHGGRLRGRFNRSRLRRRLRISLRRFRKHKNRHINISKADKEKKPNKRKDKLTDKDVRRLIGFLSMKGLINRKDLLILPESLIKKVGITIGRVVFILEAIKRKAPLLSPDNKFSQDPYLFRQYRGVLSSKEYIYAVMSVILKEKENVLIVKPTVKILLSLINSKDNLLIALIPESFNETLREDLTNTPELGDKTVKVKVGNTERVNIGYNHNTLIKNPLLIKLVPLSPPPEVVNHSVGLT